MAEIDYNKYIGINDIQFDDDVDFLPSKGKAPASKKLRSKSPELVFNLNQQAGESSSLSYNYIESSIANMGRRLAELEKRHQNDFSDDNGKLTELKKDLAMASSKLEAIADNLKCLICRSFLSPTNSVILSCCANFGCCRPCLNQWLVESATCPHCRASLSIDDVVSFPVTKQIPSIIETLQQGEAEVPECG